MMTTNGYQAFPLECFPLPVREYVQSQAKAIDCDQSAVALPVLAALASSIGSTRRIRVKRDWTEPAVLWTAVVADSGTRQRPALDAAVGVLNERQVRQFPLFEQKLKNFQRKPTVDRGPFPFLVDPFDEPPRTTEPVVDRCVSSDWNAASVIRLLTRQPRGLLVCCEELDGWLGRSNPGRTRGSVDVAHWLELHSGRSLIVEVRTAKQVPIHLPLPSVSVTGTIHPATLSQKLRKTGIRGQESGVSNASCGLLSRLLLAYPPPRPRRWTDDEVDETVTQGYGAVVEKLVALPFKDQETEEQGDEDESGPAASPPGGDSDPIDERRLQRCRIAARNRLEFMDPESYAKLRYSLANWSPNDDPRWFRGKRQIVIQTELDRMAERLARYLYLVPGSRYEKDKEVLSDGKAPTPMLVELSPEAKNRFARFVNEFGREMADAALSGLCPKKGSDPEEKARGSDPFFGPSLGPQPLALSQSDQLEGYAARLALVLHLSRWAAGERVDPAVCDLTSIEHGITLARWFANEARRIQTLLCETPDQIERRRLIEWLDRRGGQASARDLCRSNGRTYPTMEAAEAALQRLAEEGVGAFADYPPGELGGRAFRVLALKGEGRSGKEEGRQTSEVCEDFGSLRATAAGIAASESGGPKVAQAVGQSGVGPGPASTSSVPGSSVAPARSLPKNIKISAGKTGLCRSAPVKAGGK